MKILPWYSIKPAVSWLDRYLIEPFKIGVMIPGIVSFKPSMGFLGSISNALMIRRLLEGIFAYRENALNV
jgi:hypothetical protein